MKKRDFLKIFTIFICICLVVPAAIIFFVDPYCHYHDSWFGLNRVQLDCNYSGWGVVKNAKYDSILLGSSMVQNLDTDSLDEKYGTDTVKCVNTHSIDGLCYQLKLGLENHDMKYVYWGLDFFALQAEKPDRYWDKEVDYLANNNPFDDIQYLLNIDVLLYDVPYNILHSTIMEYDEGMVYSFARVDACDGKVAVGDFTPYSRTEPNPMSEDEKNRIDSNIDEMKEIVESNPNVQFVFFFTPYNIMVWEWRYRSGVNESAFYAYSEVVKELNKYENVVFYDTGMTDTSIILNAYNYVDETHYNIDVGKDVLERIGDKEYIIDEHNVDSWLQNFHHVIEVFSEKADEEQNYDFFVNGEALQLFGEENAF